MVQWTWRRGKARKLAGSYVDFLSGVKPRIGGVSNGTLLKCHRERQRQARRSSSSTGALTVGSLLAGATSLVAIQSGGASKLAAHRSTLSSGAELDALCEWQIFRVVDRICLPAHVILPRIAAALPTAARFLFAPKRPANFSPGCS